MHFRNGLSSTVILLLLSTSCRTNDDTEIKPEPITDGGAETGTDAQALGCPDGLSGPTLVELAAPDGTPYCIDQREVTAGEYKAFVVATKGDTSGQPDYCAWNTRFEPIVDDPEKADQPGHCLPEFYDPAGFPDRAASCVDWCDATAYCAWAGKRLCGKVGGGAATLAGINDPKASEWANACTQGGKTKYPWSDTYTPGMCVDPVKIQQQGPAARNIANTQGSACHGATPNFDQVFDLVGSVQEWAAECESPGEHCALHGYGSMSNPEVPVSCDAGSTYVTMTFQEVGFRCCADLTDK